MRDRAALYALLLICLAQAMSMVDRQIVAILLPRIKADLGVGDAEMGVLYGTAFALFYAVFSLPLGKLADTWMRTRILSASIALWSGMTALGGMTMSFGVLALSRLGVGIGEASVQPAGLSLISDHFAPERRGTASAAFAVSITLGLGASLWIGGTTADWWDAAYAAGLAPLGLRGWQAAFIAAALPGLVLSVFLWRLPEPERGRMDGISSSNHPTPFRTSARTLGEVLPLLNLAMLRRRRAPALGYVANLLFVAICVAGVIAMASWTDAMRGGGFTPVRILGAEISGNWLQWAITGLGACVLFNWAQNLRATDRPSFALIAKTPSLLMLFAMASLQTVVNYGVMAWTPSFLIQRFDLSAADVGLKFGAVVVVAGTVGPAIAGPLSDFFKTRFAGGRILVALLALTVSPLLAFFVYHSQSPAEFYLLFGIYCATLSMWLPPVYASFIDLVLPRMRGAVVSVYVVSTTIFGLGLGPYGVGLVSDLNGGDLAAAILSVYWFGPIIVALLFTLVWQLPRDEGSVIDRARLAGEPV